MRYDKNLAVFIASAAESVTNAAVSATTYSFANGMTRYIDNQTNLVWTTGNSRTASREAAAYYAGVVAEYCRRAEDPLTGELLHAVVALADDTQPPAVRESFRQGTVRGEKVFVAGARAAAPKAVIGERRTLTLFNREELIGWSGGRPPADLGSDVLLIDNPDGSTVVVPLGCIVERIEDGFRVMRPE